MTKKKVLFFLQDGVGGAERISVLIGKSLPLNEYDVKFYLVERGDCSSITAFIPQGYRYIRIHNANPVRMIFQLFNAIRKECPSYIFSSTMYLSTKILPFRGLFPKTKFIIRSENNLSMFSRRQQLRMRWTYRLADVIISQNEGMKDGLVQGLGLPDSKVVILLNPIDKDLICDKLESAESPYTPGEHPVYVAVGRFAYQKGFDVLVRAFAAVHKQENGAHLYIIGDTKAESGKVYDTIKSITDENNLLGFVHCPGFQNNPYPWIKYADCFVLSSRMEGLPNVLIESQFLGTPAAATKCIPIVEQIVMNGISGYTAEVEDPDSLAEAMLKAFKLGRIVSNYSSASVSEFIKLFN